MSLCRSVILIVAFYIVDSSGRGGGGVDDLVSVRIKDLRVDHKSFLQMHRTPKPLDVARTQILGPRTL